VSGGVELVDRAYQPNPERRLDLSGLANLQKPVEALEDLDILPPCRCRPAGHGQVAHDTVDVLGGRFPCRAPQCGQRPLQQPDVVVDGDLAETPSPPRRDECVDAFALELKRIR
jgi:hypothetical protein